jgi:hypothetical protein
MSTPSERRWVIRVEPWPHDSYRSGWYAGYGGLIRLRIVKDREDAYRFNDLTDALRTKANLLRQSAANHVEVEDD